MFGCAVRAHPRRAAQLILVLTQVLNAVRWCRCRVHVFDRTRTRGHGAIRRSSARLVAYGLAIVFIRRRGIASVGFSDVARLRRSPHSRARAGASAPTRSSEQDATNGIVLRCRRRRPTIGESREPLDHFARSASVPTVGPQEGTTPRVVGGPPR